MRALIRVVRFVFGLVAATVVLVGIPVMLVKIAGWPLPTYVPDPTDVMTAIEQRNIPSTFVIKALAVLLWFLWVQFAWATLWELAVNTRRIGQNRSTVQAPLVSGRMHRGAARFIASLFTATVVTGSSISSLAVATAPLTSLMVSADPVHAAGSTHLPTSAWGSSVSGASSELATWRVGKEDTLWDIARTSLGDGSRVGEILELNPTLTSARSLRSGMVLRMPAGATVPDDRAGRSSSESRGDGHLPSSTVTIVAGDTLWDLSEARVEVSIDAQATPRQTVDYLQVVIEANLDVIEDPNLIFPGEQFVLPAIGEPPAPIDAHDSQPLPPKPMVAGEPVTAPSTTVEVGQSQVMPAPSASMPETAGVPSADSSAQPSSTSKAVAESSSSQSLIAKLGVSTVLAGGVLALVRRKRVRRGARDHSQLKLLGRLDQVEGLLARRANPTMQEIAQALLLEAAEFVGREGLSGAPVAVEMSATDGIELLWDEQNTTCPASWRVIDQGWSWTAPFDDADVPAGQVEAVAAALVTLGTRDGRTLMVDLEAFGAVTVMGDTGVAEALARSIALELATGEVLSNSYVSLVGFELGATDHLPRVAQRTEAEAIRHLSGMARANREVLADSELPTMFHVRGAAPDGREATVMIVRAAACTRLDELLEHAKPRTGVAVVVLADEAVTKTTIVVDADGSGIVRDLGLDFIAAGISTAVVDGIEEVLAAIDDETDDGDGIAAAFELVDPPRPQFADVRPSEPEPVVSGVETDTDLEQIEGEDESVDDEKPTPDLFVRVIGKPRIDGVSGLSVLATSVVAFLATRGGDVPTDQLIDAVWDGDAIERKTLNNHLSNIRAKLGDLLPPISKSTSTLRLNGYVLTDLQLLAQLYERAQTEPSGEAIRLLRQGLDLVGGTPFNNRHFDWAQMGQYRSEADDLIEKVALALVDLAVDAGDHNTARAAIISGLRGVPMSESLYRARMRVDAASGDLNGVKKAYDELAHLLDNMIAGFDPSDDTIRLFDHLTNRPKSA